jgi:hypothetical protein
LIFFLNPSWGQQKRIKGPWIGFETGNLVKKYFEPGFTGYTFSLDYEINSDYYPVLELGMIDIHKEQEKMNYFTDGYFGKIGVNYNFLDYKGVWDYNILFAGLRFGMTKYEHRASNIVIENNYFGDHQIDEISEKGLNAFWTEAVIGLRVEIINNLFLGWSIRGKLKLYDDKNKKMEPYFIPGYGRGGGNTALRIQYYVSYQLPLIRSEYKEF